METKLKLSIAELFMTQKKLRSLILYLQVPLGTRFRAEEGQILADLQTEGDMFIGARGGAGGKGNHFFLTNECRAPTLYEEGGKGEERVLCAELRIMAHAGLVSGSMFHLGKISVGIIVAL